MRINLAFSQNPRKQEDNRIKHLKYRKKNNTILECHIQWSYPWKVKEGRKFLRRQNIQVICYQETYFVRC